MWLKDKGKRDNPSQQDNQSSKGKGPIGRGGWNYSSTEKWNEQAVIIS